MKTKEFLYADLEKAREALKESLEKYDNRVLTFWIVSDNCACIIILRSIAHFIFYYFRQSPCPYICFYEFAHF